MGNYLIPGHEFTDGETVSGADLTEHVSEAILKSTAISSQVLKDPATLSDELLINDGGTLKKITLQIIQTLVRAGFTTIPVGAVVDFAGPVEPDNWIFCYGQEVSRETFSALFEVIGVGYGAGNGVSTFQIPDFRGRVGAGKDNMGGATASRLADPSIHGITSTTLGSAGGFYYHILTVAQLAAHAHTFNDYYQSNTVTGGGGFIESGNDISIPETGTTLANATANAGLNNGHNNVQPTIIVNKIIRYI